MTEYSEEWIEIHRSIEKYEQVSMLIKLFSVALCLVCIVFSVNLLPSLLFMALLWLQEAIWKTFQSRLEQHILVLEESRADNNATFTLYSSWKQNRPGLAGLLKAYFFSALKPTVAYPYVVLMIIPIAYANM